MQHALLNAYKWVRARSCKTAALALKRARVDIAEGKACTTIAPPRRPDGRPFAAVSWQPNEPGLAHVSDPAAAGLRFVGRVQAECGGRNGYWDKSGDSGWYTDPYGDVFKDGTGLCYGVVYQLPGRDGRPRFVAGYQFGGTDGGPTIDLGRIFEGDRDDYAFNGDVLESGAGQEAARAADGMAQHAAEEEREYQTAWAAGSQWADKQTEITNIRREVIKDCAARRRIRGDLQTVGATGLLNSGAWQHACRAITERVQEALHDIGELRAACRALARGDADRLGFYPDSRLKDAFCEGAGIDTFPNV